MGQHTFHWFLPTSMRSRTDKFEFDITDDCKKFLNEPEYYNREIKFDSQHTYDLTFTSSVESVKIKIHPFTSAPMSNTHHANVLVESEIGSFPDFEHIFHRGNLRLARGLVILEIKFIGDHTYSENLKMAEETDINKIFSWNVEFEHMRRKMVSLANDICSYFLLALHITYPTKDNFHENHKPQSSGLISFTGKKRYIMDEHSDIFSYPLLLEADRLAAVKIVLPQIALVWHKNVWAFYRFLKGVRSDYITIDHFLDLMFTLESFFDKNTPTETMKLISALIVAENKTDANNIEQLLGYCFKVRNEVAHGGVNYKLSDSIPKKGKTGDNISIMKLYWGLKNLNIQLLYYGVKKLLNDKNPIPAKSIRLGITDVIDKCFD